MTLVLPFHHCHSLHACHVRPRRGCICVSKIDNCSRVQYCTTLIGDSIRGWRGCICSGPVDPFIERPSSPHLMQMHAIHSIGIHTDALLALSFRVSLFGPLPVSSPVNRVRWGQNQLPFASLNSLASHLMTVWAATEIFSKSLVHSLDSLAVSWTAKLMRKKEREREETLLIIQKKSSPAVTHLQLM